MYESVLARLVPNCTVLIKWALHYLFVIQKIKPSKNKKASNAKHLASGKVTSKKAVSAVNKSKTTKSTRAEKEQSATKVQRAKPRVRFIESKTRVLRHDSSRDAVHDSGESLQKRHIAYL